MIFRVWETGHVYHSLQQASSPVYISSPGASSTGDRCPITGPAVTTGICLEQQVVPSACLRLSSCTTNQQYFQERSLSSPQLLGDPLQIECTTTGGYASLMGLQGKDLIHLVPQLLKYPLFCMNFLILKTCRLRLSKDTGPV